MGPNSELDINAERLMSTGSSPFLYFASSASDGAAEAGSVQRIHYYRPVMTLDSDHRKNRRILASPHTPCARCTPPIHFQAVAEMDEVNDSIRSSLPEKSLFCTKTAVPNGPKVPMITHNRPAVTSGEEGPRPKPFYGHAYGPRS